MSQHTFLELPANWDQQRDPFNGTKHPRKPCTPAPVGSGPEGETCGTCAFRTYGGGGIRAHQKCALMEKAWTHGPGSDIKAKWSACREWRPIAGESQ